ncbi:MAG: SGNH/GDSL hydrolase family protein [Limisphaerales bacterium]
MNLRCFAILLFSVFLLLPAFATTNLVWHDVRTLPIEGKGWTDTRNFYDRLPARAQKVVRAPVWELSQNSAGISARFVTDATTISARWTLRKEQLGLPHMPASGVSGLDLYVKESDGWRWVGAGRPRQTRTNEVELCKNLLPGKREYMLYLPLYNGVTSVHLGVPRGASFAPGEVRKTKPLVFYGTSILQGACASRPGLAYPAILGRKLDRAVINLGFSGNAFSEPELAELLSELDPALYVIDPLPNMQAPAVLEKLPPFVKRLRKAHPTIPIVLVENIQYTDAFLVRSRHERYTSSNAALRQVYEQLTADGVKNLHYIPGDELLGPDGEGTVDGTHPNDLGFIRMAEKMEPVLRSLLR